MAGSGGFRHASRPAGGGGRGPKRDGGGQQVAQRTGQEAGRPGGGRLRPGPAAGLIILALFISAAYLYASSMGRQARIGQEAPPFQLPSLEAEHSLGTEDFAGSPLVVNFFASWCEPCRDEMPALQAVWHAADAGAAHAPPAFQLLGVNVEEPAFRAEAFVRELGVHFPVVLDGNSRVKRLYNVRGLPETFFIDARGVLRHVHRGPLDEQSFAYLVSTHLAPDRGEEGAAAP